MNRKILVACGVVILGLLAWHYAGLFSHDAKSKPAPIPVTAATVKASDVPLYLTGIGTVQAFNTVTVRARVDGELVNVGFREGQPVKKGQLLAQIDQRPYRAALDLAVATKEKDAAQLTNAKRDLDRYILLEPEDFTSKQTVDTQRALVAQLEAQVKGDQATVDNARTQLDYTTIISPLDGRTGVRLIDQGNIIHAVDAGGLVVITQTQPVAVLFTLPQSSLQTVAAAQAHGPLPVTAISRDDTAELGKGTLELIDNQIDPTTGTVRLKAYFPNMDNTLWPGAFVNARLQTGQRHDAITVATQVVQRGTTGLFAYVIKDDKSVEVRPITVGPEYRGQTLVSTGLKAGETVVVDGQLRLQPGTVVKVVEDGPQAVAADAR